MASLLDLLLGKSASGSSSQAAQTTVVKRPATAAEKAKAAAAQSLASGTSLNTTPAKSTTSTPAKSTASTATAQPPKKATTVTKRPATTAEKAKAAAAQSLASGTSLNTTPAKSTAATQQQTAVTGTAPSTATPTVNVGGQTIPIPAAFAPLVSTVPLVGSFAGVDYAISPASAPPSQLATPSVGIPTAPIGASERTDSGQVADSPSNPFQALVQQYAPPAQDVFMPPPAGSQQAIALEQQLVNPPQGVAHIDETTGQYVTAGGALLKTSPEQLYAYAQTGVLRETQVDLFVDVAAVFDAQYGAGALAQASQPLVQKYLADTYSLEGVALAGYTPPSSTPTTPGATTPPGTTPTTPGSTPTTPGGIDVPPGISGGDSALSQFLEPKRLLVFAAIGLLTGIWLIGN